MISSFQATRAKFREAVRRFLRDRAPYNTLLGDKETDDYNLDMCIDLALSDFNDTPPPIGDYGIANFPSFKLLLDGTVIEVLVSARILQARNRLTYNAAGVSVKLSDKAGDYGEILAGMIQRYEITKRNKKIAINMSQCWGGVSSEYGLIQDY